jgi:hypothetical protein
MLPSSRAKRTPREDAGQLPALLLDQGSLPTDYLPLGRNTAQKQLRGDREEVSTMLTYYVKVLRHMLSTTVLTGFLAGNN